MPLSFCHNICLSFVVADQFAAYSPGQAQNSILEQLLGLAICAHLSPLTNNSSEFRYPPSDLLYYMHILRDLGYRLDWAYILCIFARSDETIRLFNCSGWFPLVLFWFMLHKSPKYLPMRKVLLPAISRHFIRPETSVSTSFLTYSCNKSNIHYLSGTFLKKSDGSMMKNKGVLKI